MYRYIKIVLSLILCFAMCAGSAVYAAAEPGTSDEAGTVEFASEDVADYSEAAYDEDDLLPEEDLLKQEEEAALIEMEEQRIDLDADAGETAAAEIQDTSGTCGDSVKWTLAEGVLTISGTGKMADYEMRTAPWSAYSGGIIKVVIKKGVTRVGAYAFYDCDQVTSVSLGSTVTEIGKCAFAFCEKIQSISFPASLKKIGNSAFRFCYGLKSVTIPDNVTNIYAYAFRYCDALTEVNLGIGLKELGTGAFEYCESLTGITADTANKTFASKNGILFNKAITKLICYPQAKGYTSYSIPDTVTTIGKDAFYCCSDLTSVTIPKSVKTIGAYAFCGCTGLTGITIPASVEVIGSGAFYECSGITAVKVPDSVREIGEYAFFRCTSLGTVTIGINTVEIGAFAFTNCNSLKSITVAGGNNCYKTDSGVLFNAAKTELITYPALRSGASYFVPDTVTKIDDYAFNNCTGLVVINIGIKVKTIGDYAFLNCTNLKAVTIPATVKTIGTAAAYNCTGLTDIYYGNADTNWNNIAKGDYNSALYSANMHYKWAPPVLINVTNAKKGLLIKWDPTPGADNYQVYRQETGKSWEYLATVKGTSYTDTKAADRKTYTYKVRAYAPLASVLTSCSGTITRTRNPFTDVLVSDGFYEYVMWAYDRGIVKGTSKTTFSPKDICTRGQAATLLYKLAGSPSVSGKLPFSDVTPNDGYYNAILWAYNAGIIKGYSDHTFRPKTNCTRGQIVTMLYKFAGQPSVTSVTNPFKDVKKSDGYYNAIMWAYKNGITKGTSDTKFSPKAGCKRSQIATFLYRFVDYAH